MVTIKDYKQRVSKEGDEFFVLVLQGGVVPVKSKETGRMYFTAKTATASCTFDEETCRSLIGSQFPGQIIKVETEPYQYELPESGEVIELSHRWEYQDDSMVLASKSIIEESEVM